MRGLLPLLEADPVGLGETQPSHFSIRDYVFKSRSKDVKTHWPFPQQFLQICLQHGVRDLLPPFEPSSLVRAKCSRKRVEPEQLVACSEAEQISSEFQALDIGNSALLIAEVDSIEHVPSDQSVIGCSNQNQHQLLEEKIEFGQSILDDKLVHTEVEPRFSGKLEILREPLEKKCRLIVKLDAIFKPSQIEDKASTYSTGLDPMASKVCPVCRTFTSTSNTTMNAHMDQCLSAESNTKLALTTSSKIKVKPRKKRLMVDIYATAPPFTLEDLDKRNGTNWAVELVSPTETGETFVKTKRSKLSPMDSSDGGKEGVVYVDSYGTKLRMLSQLSDVPQDMPRKHLKESKAEPSYLTSKKKQFRGKHTKYMKVSPQSKELSSIKRFKGEVQATREGGYLEDTDQGDKESPTCSCLPVKLKNNDIHKSLGNTVLSTSNPTLEDNGTEIAKLSAARSRILKLATSYENFSTCLKTKRGAHSVGISSMNLKPKETTACKHVMLKSPTSSVSFTSSLRSRKERIHMGTMKKCKSLSRMGTMISFKSSYLSAKVNKRLLAKQNVSSGKPFYIEGKKGYRSQKNLRVEKFCRRRSMIGIGKMGRVPRSLFDSILHGCVKAFSLDSGRANKKSRVCHSSFSENDQLSQNQSNIETSEAANSLVVSTRLNYALKRLDTRSECSCPSTARYDVQVKALADLNSVRVPSMEKAIGTSRIETLFSENIEPYSEAKSDKVVEPLVQSFVDERQTRNEDVKIDDNISQSAYREDEMGFQGEENSCKVQFVQCGTSTACTEESGACLTSCGDSEQIPQRNSSMSSTRVMIPNKDHGFDTNKKSFGSPASATSTISHPSPEDHEFRSSWEEGLARPVVIRNKLSPILPRITALPSSTSSRGTEGKMERENLEVKKGEYFADNVPCCCSQREILSRDPQFSRQGFMAGMVLPLYGKEMSTTSSVKTSMLSTSDARPSLESANTLHTESIMKFPQARTQATSNPILRLMGKNLVVNKDASSMELPKVSPPNSHNSINARCSSFRYSSTESVPYWNGYLYHQQQLPGGSPLIGLAPSKRTTTWSNLKTNEPGQHSYPKRMSKIPVSSSLQSPYVAREVFAIDDSPQLDSEHKESQAGPAVTLLPMALGMNIMPQRSFPCLPSQITNALGEAPHLVSPFVPVPHPRPSTNLINQGSISGGLVPLVQNPFTFASHVMGSTGYAFNPTFYYSPTS